MKLLFLLITIIFSAQFYQLSPLSTHWHTTAKKYELSMFYCGFGQDFCGQSTDNDVNKVASYVILAFVNTNTDGSVALD